MSPVFDPRDIERDPVIEVVTQGIYRVRIEKVGTKEDNFGFKLRIFYKVLDGAYQDCFLMDNFNLEHGKPEVAQIGKKQFTRVLDCLGMGKQELDKYSDIVGKDLKIEVKIKPHYKDPSATQNEIIKYTPVNAIDVNAAKYPSKREIDSGSDVPF